MELVGELVQFGSILRECGVVGTSGVACRELSRGSVIPLPANNLGTAANATPTPFNVTISVPADPVNRLHGMSHDAGGNFWMGCAIAGRPTSQFQLCSSTIVNPGIVSSSTQSCALKAYFSGGAVYPSAADQRSRFLGMLIHHSFLISHPGTVPTLQSDEDARAALSVCLLGQNVVERCPSLHPFRAQEPRTNPGTKHNNALHADWPGCRECSADASPSRPGIGGPQLSQQRKNSL